MQRKKQNQLPVKAIVLLKVIERSLTLKAIDQTIRAKIRDVEGYGQCRMALQCRIRNPLDVVETHH
jgi:hypothetical protein